jgi:tetratricopeptide (TPR) repeat protein
MTSAGHGSSPTAPTEAARLTMRELLTRPDSRGLILQNACPIAESIPWLCSQQYWAQAGVEVFTSGEVPYVATNDGEQSCKALDVYLASLRAAERQGRREPHSYVLELGTGSGVFAKLFLDQLRSRAIEERSDDYERTTYIVCDHSPGLLRDTQATGVFADHEAHVQRVLLPAGDIRSTVARAVPDAVGALRAVHANYVFDSMPFTILSVCDRGLFELRIATRLLDEPMRAPPPIGDLASLLRWLSELADSPHHALRYESEYVVIDRAALAYPELVHAHADGVHSQQFVHSYGALSCLDDVLSLLRPDGYFIATDYGYDGGSAEPIEFQCFGTSVAAGVNFVQLMNRARSLPGVVAIAPDSDPSQLQARLFARDQVSDDVTACFRERYDKATWDRTDAPYREALELMKAGRFEAARWKFDEAHRLQPHNWNLLETIASFLTYSQGEHASALEVAKRALQLNHLSSRAWNLLGDAYYGLASLDEAERAYRQAMRVNPADARSRANLAYVFLKRGTPGDALTVLGEALALDRAAAYRDELLGKQSEALHMLAERQARRALGDLHRLIGQHALPSR